MGRQTNEHAWSRLKIKGKQVKKILQNGGNKCLPAKTISRQIRQLGVFAN
jgi:hypothetical protein